VTPGVSSALSSAHTAWVAENLLRGVLPARLVATLVAAEVPEDVAAREVDAIARSPVLAGAVPLAREARRLALIVRLQREMAAQSPFFREIERRADVAPDEFFARYVAGSTPVVLTEPVRRWPAFGRWTPEFFRDHYGDVSIDIVDGRDADPDYDRHTPAHTRTVTMRAYVERILAAGETNDFYAVAQNRNLDRDALQPLWADLALPEGILDARRSRGCAALWLGPAGTVTPLHHDTSNILVAQLHGRKRFVLAAPTETALLEGATGVYAGADPERLGAIDADVRFLHVDLAPGEMLFLPVGWWHHVRALDVSVSVALNGFVKPNAFDWYRPGQL
jgi:hypothetical protein